MGPKPALPEEQPIYIPNYNNGSNQPIPQPYDINNGYNNNNNSSFNAPPPYAANGQNGGGYNGSPWQSPPPSSPLYAQPVFPSLSEEEKLALRKYNKARYLTCILCALCLIAFFLLAFISNELSSSTSAYSFPPPDISCSSQYSLSYSLTTPIYTSYYQSYNSANNYISGTASGEGGFTVCTFTSSYSTPLISQGWLTFYYNTPSGGGMCAIGEKTEMQGNPTACSSIQAQQYSSSCPNALSNPALCSGSFLFAENTSNFTFYLYLYPSTMYPANYDINYSFYYNLVFYTQADDEGGASSPSSLWSIFSITVLFLLGCCACCSTVYCFALYSKTPRVVVYPRYN